MYIDKLDNIVNKYNNTYHNTIKMKPVDVKSSTYIDSSKDNSKSDPKFETGDIVKISKYKNIFTKSLHSKLVWKLSWLKKIKDTVPWTYVIIDLNGEEIAGTFHEKELQKTNQKEFRIEKVIK